MAKLQKITPCIWYDTEAAEAAAFYVSVFDNAKIVRTLHYGEAGYEIHGMPAGSVLTVEFELDGQRFTALNGGSAFKLTEAFSLEINCETQAEIDYFWERLSEGGEKSVCGWLKDKFGLSWQVGSTAVNEMLDDPDRAKTERVMAALLQMQKIDIAALEQAYAGG